MGLLSDIVGMIDRAKQSAKANVGLLVSDPREYMASLNDQARAFNQASNLATQAKLNEMRGLLVTPEQASAKEYVDRVNQDLAMGFAGTTKVGNISAKEKFLKPSVVKQRVYHGTTSTDVARPEEAIAEFRGNRTWFSGNPEYANVYAGSETASHGIGGYVLPLNAQVTNPKIFPATQEGFSDWGKNSRSDRALKAEGYDGVLFLDKEGNLRTGYVFSPNQLKSAIGNRGTYDVTNPSILAAGVPLGLIGATEVELPKKKNKKAKQ